MKKRNNLKYKNKTGLLQKVIAKINGYFYVPKDSKVYTATHEIEEVDFKYLYKNLHKINQSMSEFAEISLNNYLVNSEMKYFATLNLRATQNE